MRGGRATIRTGTPPATVAALAAWARGLGADELPGLAVTRPSLEDVYLSLIDERAGGGAMSLGDTAAAAPEYRPNVLGLGLSRTRIELRQFFRNPQRCCSSSRSRCC